MRVLTAATHLVLLGIGIRLSVGSRTARADGIPPAQPAAVAAAPAGDSAVRSAAPSAVGSSKRTGNGGRLHLMRDL